MASSKISSPTSLSATNNIITASSVPATTNSVLQQLQQLQRITQQMPTVFMASTQTTSSSANNKMMTTSSAPKSTAITTNNVFQQLQQLQRITQQIAPNSNIIPTISAQKSGAATTNNVQKFTQISLTANSNIFKTSSAPKSVADTTHKAHQQQQQPRKQQGPRLSYVIYLHLEEMKRSKATKLSKAKVKYQLTHELISKTMRTVYKLSPDEMEIVSQQTIYKKNLEREIATEKHKIYMDNYQKRQKANFPKKQQQKQSLSQHGNVGGTTMEGIPSPGYFSRST